MTSATTRWVVADKTSKQGEHLLVWVQVDGASAALYSAIGGQPDMSGLRVGHAAGLCGSLPEALRRLGFVAAVGRIPLTAEEFARVAPALAEADAAATLTPAGLRGRRAALAMTVRSLRGAEDRARRQAWESEDERRAFETPATVRAALVAAGAELAAFDREHPAIVAAIRAEAAADAARKPTESEIWS